MSATSSRRRDVAGATHLDQGRRAVYAGDFETRVEQGPRYRFASAAADIENRCAGGQQRREAFDPGAFEERAALTLRGPGPRVTLVEPRRSHLRPTTSPDSTPLALARFRRAPVDDETCAAERRALDVRRAAVPFDDPLDDREPEAEAGLLARRRPSCTNEPNTRSRSASAMPGPSSSTHSDNAAARRSRKSREPGAPRDESRCREGCATRSPSGARRTRPPSRRCPLRTGSSSRRARRASRTRVSAGTIAVKSCGRCSARPRLVRAPRTPASQSRTH